MKTNFLIIALAITFTCCKKEDALKNYMVDSWQTSYLKLEMPTVRKSDSTQVMIDDFSKKDAMLAQSVYKDDGTFKAWYLMSNGNKTGETDGKWSVKGDSLFTEYTFMGRIVSPSYFIEKTAEGISLKSLFDWDNDGQKDDILFMQSKRIELDEK